MRRFFGTVSTALLILLVAGGGIALAAELEVVKGPDGTGPQDITIDVWDFDPNTSVYVVPCDVPSSGDPADVTTDTCDIADVATATTDADGAASFDVTWDVPDGGIAVFAGDELRTEVVTDVLSIGDPGVEVLGTSTTADALPVTGSETLVLITVGVGLVALGGATLGTSRRLTPVVA